MLTPEQIADEEERAAAHLMSAIPILRAVYEGGGFSAEEHDLLLQLMGSGMIYGIVLGLRAAQGKAELNLDALIPDDISDLL